MATRKSVYKLLTAFATITIRTDLFQIMAFILFVYLFMIYFSIFTYRLYAPLDGTLGALRFASIFSLFVSLSITLLGKEFA